MVLADRMPQSVTGGEMARRCAGLLSTSAIAALAAALSAHAQDAPSPTPPPVAVAASPQGPLAAWLSGIQVTGQVEAGATFNPANPDTGINFGRLFTDKANQAVLNQVDLRAVREPDDRGDRPDFGFAIEGLYGLDAQFTHFEGIGDQGSAGRNAFDLVETNLKFAAPIGPGVRFDAEAGLFVTPMGYETLDPTADFFTSHSYIFDFGLPRKHTGILTTTHLGDGFEVYLGYDTGVNTSIGPGGGYDDAQPHGLGGVAFHGRDVTVAAFAHIGPEDNPIDLPRGVDAHKKLRYYGDLFASWRITDRLTWATEFDYVRDDGLKADAGGVAQYLTYRLTPRLSLGARAEVFRDAEGDFVLGYPGNLDYLDVEEGLPNTAFKAGPATYGALTLGLDITPALDLNLAGHPLDSPFGPLTVRPEVRFDRVLAGAADFGGVPGTARGQVTFAVDVVVPLTLQHAPATREAWPAGAAGDEASGTADPTGPPAASFPSPPGAEWIATAAGGAAQATASGFQQLAVVDRPQLAVADPRTLQDLDGDLPDVSFGETPTGEAAPTIRGVSDAGAHTGQAPAVGLALDGVTIDAAFAQLLDPFDFASVQVRYGPSGQTDGRDATGGIIDIFRRQPTRAWSLDAQYGLEQGFHANTERVRLDAPVGQTAGVALSVSHRQTGGDLDDIYQGAGLFGRNETTQGALQFDWSLTPRLEAAASVTLAHADGVGEPLAQGDALDAQTLGSALQALHPGLQFNAYGSPYLPGATQPLGAFQTASTGADGQSLSAQLYTLNLAYSAPFGRIVSITGVLRETQATSQDLDGGCAGVPPGGPPCQVIANPLVGVLQQSSALRYEQVSEEARIDHDFGSRIALRLGVFFLHDDTASALATRTAADALASATAAGQTAQESEATAAAFGQLTIQATPRLSLSGGARLADDHETWSAADSLPGLPGASINGAETERRVLSRLAAEYRLADQVTLYVDRATGFRPGGLPLGATLSEETAGQPNFGAGAAAAAFRPETDITYEGGVRGSLFGDRLTGRITGYYTTASGFQVPELVLTPGSAEAFDTFVVNLPKVETKGVEAQAAWRPPLVAGLTLSALGGFEDARIVDGVVPAAELAVNAMGTAGAPGATFNLTGTPLVRTPRFNGTVRASYSVALGPGRFDLDGAVTWTDRQALAVLAGQGDDQGAYAIESFEIAYSRSFYRLTVAARNIADHYVFEDAVPVFFAHAWAEPRTVVVSLEAKF